MLTPISTNGARKMIEDALGIPKVNLEAVRHFFLCISGDPERKGTPKFWELRKPIKLEEQSWYSRNSLEYKRRAKSSSFNFYYFCGKYLHSDLPYFS